MPGHPKMTSTTTAPEMRCPTRPPMTVTTGSIPGRKCVPEEDTTFGQPPGAGVQDVVAPELVEHPAACETCHRGDLLRREHEGRQRQMPCHVRPRREARRGSAGAAHALDGEDPHAQGEPQ